MYLALTLYFAAVFNSWWVFGIYPIVALFRFMRAGDRDAEKAVINMILDDVK